jgi:hypothetical protein
MQRRSGGRRRAALLLRPGPGERRAVISPPAPTWSRGRHATAGGAPPLTESGALLRSTEHCRHVASVHSASGSVPSAGHVHALDRLSPETKTGPIAGPSGSGGTLHASTRAVCDTGARPGCLGA